MAALHQGTPGQMTWLEDPPVWLRPAYCFASVIVWTENKKMLPYLTALLFYFERRNNQRRWRPVFWGPKRSSAFFRKKCTPRENPGYTPDSEWPGLRIFWPQNDLAPLLRWRRYQTHKFHSAVQYTQTSLNINHRRVELSRRIVVWTEQSSAPEKPWCWPSHHSQCPYSPRAAW